MLIKPSMKAIPLGLAMTAVLMFGAPAHAQTAPDSATKPPMTRTEIKMETVEFLRTHRWDESASVWVTKAGVDAPAGVKPRAEVKAERDTFLRANRWVTETGNWAPMKSGPRDLGTMTRAQLAAETKKFLATHTFDEEKGAYVERKPMAPRKTK
ncbi:MAG: hypothetical protein ABIR56_20010 [Polaromonas sp.]